MNSSSSLPVNWFDLFVLIMLAAGYIRGKQRGMSQEFLTVLKWVALMLLAAIAYQPLGLWLDSVAHLGKLWSFIIAYVTTALLVLLAFVAVNRTLGARLKGTDTFGKGEFYLAIPAGILRFACIVVVFAALLNARYYSTAEVKASQKYDLDNYGSNFFPRLYSVQDDVFVHSFTGKQLKTYLGFLLIEPTPAISGPPTTTARKEFTW